MRIAKSKLTQLLNKLPRTKKKIEKIYGKKATEEKQLFIKKKDARIMAATMSLDLADWKEEEFQIEITNGNRKLESIPSLAFSPFLTCLSEKCLKICYGTDQKYLGFFKFFYMVKNTYFFIRYEKAFIRQLNVYLNLYQPRYFRFFENGDLIDIENLKAFNQVAAAHPEISFLLMTKKTDIANEFLTENGGKYAINFVLRFSNSDVKECHIKKDNPFNILTTEIVEKGEKITKNSTRCPGSSFSCLRCLKCWKSRLNVEFEKHR